MSLFDNEEGTRLLSPSPDVRLNSQGYLNTNHSLSYFNYLISIVSIMRGLTCLVKIII